MTMLVAKVLRQSWSSCGTSVISNVVPNLTYNETNVNGTNWYVDQVIYSWH